MFKVFIIMMASVFTFLEGCVGLGGVVLGDQKVFVERPILSTKRGFISDKSKVIESVDTTTLKKYWGEPDKREQLDNNREKWEYGFDKMRWHGVIILVVIVPVPIVVPLGHNYVTLEINDGRVVSAETKFGDIDALAFCGFSVMMKGGWSCGAGTSSRDRPYYL